MTISRIPDEQGMEFDTYPKSAQRFMMDMAYNGGVGYLRKRHMATLIRDRKWLAGLPHVPRDGDQHRAAWRETMLRNAAVEDER
jgi:hypothetical protein